MFQRHKCQHFIGNQQVVKPKLVATSTMRHFAIKGNPIVCCRMGLVLSTMFPVVVYYPGMRAIELLDFPLA